MQFLLRRFSIAANGDALQNCRRLRYPLAPKALYQLQAWGIAPGILFPFKEALKARFNQASGSNWCRTSIALSALTLFGGHES